MSATDIDIIMDSIDQMSDLPRPLQPTERLAVTLEAQQWNQILALLHDVAATGGVAVGQLYRNGSVVQIRVT